MQQSLGLPVRWLTSGEVDAINPTMAPGCTLGATYCDEDGYITPPRNVAAYTAALVASGVVIAERTRFGGLVRAAAPAAPAAAEPCRRRAARSRPGWWCWRAGRSWRRSALSPGSRSRRAGFAIPWR